MAGYIGASEQGTDGWNLELNLKGKKVVVTGASRGIGYAIAEGFAAEGADVAICARGRDGLVSAADRLSGQGGQVYMEACDVGQADQIEGFVNNAAKELGGIDILVNNPSAFGRTDDEEGWRTSIDVDLMALVRASWAAIPHIRKSGGGAIVHISSISALGPSSAAPYGAIKATVMQYTLTQARELAADNIRVNCIAPGSIEFPGGVWDDAKQNNPERYSSTLATIPFGRMGRPEEMANLAVFLGSEAASWITGQIISADGGQTLS